MLSYHYLKRTYSYNCEYKGDTMEYCDEFNKIFILFSIYKNDNMSQILNSITKNEYECLTDREDEYKISCDYIDKKLDITNYKTNENFLKIIKNTQRYNCYILIDYNVINDSNIGLFIELIDWLLLNNKNLWFLTFSIKILNNSVFTNQLKEVLNLNEQDITHYIYLFETSYNINDNILKNYIKNYKYSEDKLFNYYLSKINIVIFESFNNQLNWLPSHITYLNLEIDHEIDCEILNLPCNLKYLSIELLQHGYYKIFKSTENVFLPIGLKYLKLNNIILNNISSLPYTIEYLEISNDSNANFDADENYADNSIECNNIKNLSSLLNDLPNLKCLIIKDDLILDKFKNRLVFPETLKLLVINNIDIVDNLDPDHKNIIKNKIKINELIKFPDTLEKLYICPDCINECKNININNGNCTIDSYYNYNYNYKYDYNYINIFIFPNKYIIGKN